MSVVSLEKYAQGVLGEHAEQVAEYSLGRFMDDLHSDESGHTSEADRGGDEAV